MGLLDRWIKKKTAEQLNHEASTEQVEKKVSPKEETVLSNSKEKSHITERVNKSKKENKKEVSLSSASSKSVRKKNEENIEKKPVVKGSVYHKIISPVVTEKSTFLQSDNKYVFKVHRTSSKQEIKKAIEELYSIKPLAVNTMNIDGKKVRFGRTMGRRSDFKKVIVTVPKGSSIKINEAV